LQAKLQLSRVNGSIGQAPMVNHPHAKATSIIVMNIGGKKRVLMVDTDLKIDQSDPAYRAHKVFGLHKACQAFVDKFPLVFDTYAIRAWK